MAPAQVPIFALMPTQVDNKIIIYTSSTCNTLCIHATTKLSIPFDGDHFNQKTFMESIQQKENSSNWVQIMAISDKHCNL
jgi:hypothetical protein